MDQRSFFHSFPRPRGETVADAMKKGLRVLELVMNFGLILAPETVVWRLPQVDGTDREIEVEMCRICFTELGETELPAHSERFGAFALEFSISRLRQMRALPVIYMPQSVSADQGFSNAGSLLVAMLGHVKYTLDQLENLRRHTDEEWVKANVVGATSIQDDAVFDLRNTNDSGSISATYKIPMNTTRDLLAFVGFQNAPMWMLRNSLEFLENLFYPTDNEESEELLVYYRQREWRIAPGLSVDGSTLERELTVEEKCRVIEVAPDFWTHEIRRRGISLRRIDAAKIIDHLDGRPVHEQICSVIVPAGALDDAKRIVNGRIPVRVLNLV